MDIRARLRRQIEDVVGRHDDPSMYGGPAGDPGLTGGPGSLSWEVNGHLPSVLAAGLGAIVMEVLHPSVMDGVFTQSSYRAQPTRRAQETLGYVLRTTFGNTEAATRLIERVRRIHGRVGGVRADGVAYRALDPDLVAWVHTCIPWAIMTAYDRYVRPLTTAEKDRYLREQAVVGRMGGADRVPETVAELDDYVERMRPLMAMTEQTRSFIGFMVGDTEGEFHANRAQQLDRRLQLAASMSLMPVWARHLTGTYQPTAVRRLYLEPTARLQMRLVGWAYPELPCKRLALARAEGRASASAPPEAGAGASDPSAAATPDPSGVTDSGRADTGTGAGAAVA
jgi:uncharacterized protein (DUF2236 family)